MLLGPTEAACLAPGYAKQSGCPCRMFQAVGVLGPTYAMIVHNETDLTDPRTGAV